MYIPPGRIHCHRPTVNAAVYRSDGRQPNSSDGSLDGMFVGGRAAVVDAFDVHPVDLALWWLGWRRRR